MRTKPIALNDISQDMMFRVLKKFLHKPGFILSKADIHTRLYYSTPIADKGDLVQWIGCFCYGREVLRFSMPVGFSWESHLSERNLIKYLRRETSL